MWNDITFKEINLNFFKDIEGNGAFSLIIDENGNFVPAAEPKYHLFASCIYPFAIYEEEMRSLNQYCYEAAQAVERYADNSVQTYQKYASMNESEFDVHMFTKDEMMLGCQEEIYLCENIVWHSSSHIITLLYSFLERTLKKLGTDLFQQEGKNFSPPESRIKLYASIEKIFGMSIRAFSQKHPDVYQQLDTVRRYRNQVVHGKFKVEDANNEYCEGKELPSFQLIELLDLISTVLDLVESEYLSVADTKK